MKNATMYEKRMRKLLPSLGKGQAPYKTGADPIRVLIESVLLPNASRKQVEAALEGLETEFVDYNELRVSPPKEIVERCGKDMPYAREKAERLVKALNAVFDKGGELSVAYMHKMTKRDLRKHLLEIGLEPFSAAYLTLILFNGHAVCVDESLLDALLIEDCINPDSDIEDVQGFLERIIPQKDAPAVHESLRKLVDKHAKALAKKRQERIAAQAAKEEATRAAQAAKEAKALEQAAKPESRKPKPAKPAREARRKK